MTKKRNLLFLIMGLLVLICTGYALFITVFEQIISQNEGFFYALVFGGILILAYILINIIAKLMIITDKAHHSKALVVFCFVGLAAVCTLFAFTTLGYQTTISPSEATYYAAGEMINNETLGASSDLISKIMDNPAQYLYALLFSVLFGFIEDSSSILIVVNIALCSLAAVFAYLLTTRITDKLCGLCAAFAMLFLPGQLFCVYSYSTECFMAMIFLATLYFGVELISADSKGKKIIFGILYSVFASFMIASEPVTIVGIVLILLIGLSIKPRNLGGYAIFSLVALVFFAGIMYYKSIQIDEEYLSVLQNLLAYFDNTTVSSTGAINTSADIKSFFDTLISADSSHIENNVYYLMSEDGSAPSTLLAAWMTLGNQVAYMFILILCISSIFFSMVNKDNRVYPYLCALFSVFIVLYFEVSRESHGYTLRCLLAIIAAVGIHYIYLNHHPEESYAWSRVREEDLQYSSVDDTDESTEDIEAIRLREEEMLRRANALIFADDNIELYNQIKAEEQQNARNSISITENPNSASLELTDSAPPVIDELPPAIDEIPPAIDEAFVTEDTAPVRENKVPVTVDTASEIASSEQKSEVTYIDNPLPVPQRRPHSSVDYDYDIDDSDYDWDIDVFDD